MSSPFSLEGQVGVVTGALTTRGIGRSMVLEALRAGAARVYATDLKKMCDANAAGLLEEAGDDRDRIAVAALNVTSEEETEELLKRVCRDEGRCDFFWANAGTITPGANLFNTGDSTFDREVAIMTKGPLWAVKVGSRALAVTGPNKPEPKGSIVFTVSTTAVQGGWSDEVSYVVAKHGAVGVMHAAVPVLAHTWIRVNCFAAGNTDTHMGKNAGIPVTASMVESVVSRGATTGVTKALPPEGPARVAVFLSSPAGEMVNGQIIVADRGMSAAPPFGLVRPLEKVEPLI